MRLLVLIMLMFIPSVSFPQEWMLGESKEFILNEYKEYCSISLIDESSITLKCSQKNYTRYFKFEKGKCVAILYECSEDIKNYFIAKYLEDGYKVEVFKKQQDNTIVTWFIFKNSYYSIEIMDAKAADLYMIQTSYLGYLK